MKPFSRRKAGPAGLPFLAPPAAIAFAVSLSTLWHLEFWNGALSLRSPAREYFDASLDHTLEFAALLSTIGVAAALCCAVLAARRLPEWGRRSAEALFPLSLIWPVTVLWGCLLGGRPAGGFGERLVFALACAPLIYGAVAALFLNRLGVVRVCRTAVVLLSPLLPIILVSLVWAHIEWLRDTRMAGAAALRAPAAQNRSGARVAWIVFDEFDQTLAFGNSGPRVPLPQFERLRRESFWSEQAHSPANATIRAIPAMLLGIPVYDAWPAGANRLEIELPGGRTAGWDLRPSIFAEARAMGMRTAAVSWLHPLCRVAHGDLDACFAQPCSMVGQAAGEEAYAERIGLLSSVGHVLRSVLERQLWWFESTAKRALRIERENRLSEYSAIRDHSARLLADPGMGFVYLHFPVPHPVCIYNHSRGIDLEHPGDYFDSLALADATLGEMRLAMERAGVWDSTTVIVTSDHPYRASWGSPSARLQSAAVTQYSTVPFIVKLARSRAPYSYQPVFNTVWMMDLTLALLRREIDSPRGVAEWLDEQQAASPAVIERLRASRSIEMTSGAAAHAALRAAPRNLSGKPARPSFRFSD